MRPTSIMSLSATLLLTSIVAANSATAETKRPLAIAIHGGAGVIAREQLGPDGGATYRAGLAEALDAGYAVLERGGSSLDAVTTAVRILEDNPLFNAGRGAVLTHEGKAELDASIMTGHDLKAGAVAGVKRIRHPIDLARKVMEDSPHVMLYGAGAEEFAGSRGEASVDAREGATIGFVHALRRMVDRARGQMFELWRDGDEQLGQRQFAA